MRKEKRLEQNARRTIIVPKFNGDYLAVKRKIAKYINECTAFSAHNILCVKTYGNSYHVLCDSRNYFFSETDFGL